MFKQKKNNQATLTEDAQSESRPVISIEQKQQSTTVFSKKCHIKGDILGTDDVSIFGKIEGVISVKANLVTVEKTAEILADIFAKTVHVSGSVSGNITAGDKILVLDGGNVIGNLSAPKVILKEGSYFKGNVSMPDTEKTNKPKAILKKN
jgi:cytoskeletal protein CcmA (bactofilin family)